MRSPSTSSSFTGGKPRVGERGAVGVVRDVRRERAGHLQAADAAAQATVRLQGHERGAPLVQRRRQAIEVDGACLPVLDPVANRARGDAEQMSPRFEIEGLVRGLEERVGTVADHVIPGPRGVAGVAHVERRRFQAAPLRKVKQPVHRMPPARLLAANVVVAQRDDGLRGLRVEAPRALMVEEVAQIRADDDRRLRPAPERFEQRVDLGGRRGADQERHHARTAEAPASGTGGAPPGCARARTRGRACVRTGVPVPAESTPCRPGRGRGEWRTSRRSAPRPPGPGGSARGRAAPPGESRAPEA